MQDIWYLKVIYFLVYSITDKESFQSLQDGYQYGICKLDPKWSFGAVLVGNKYLEDQERLVMRKVRHWQINGIFHLLKHRKNRENVINAFKLILEDHKDSVTK